MACTDCLKNCGDSLTTDKCVLYTGPDIAILGICNGDSLFEWEEIIAAKLTGIVNGTSITLEDVTLDCDLVTTLLDGEEKTVANLVQVLLTAACETKEQLDDLSAQVNASFSISGGCLTLGANPTRDQVLQATITKLCSVSTSVSTIAADYVKATELCALVTACIASTGSGSGSSSDQENLKMSKYIAYPYHGPLTVFDSGGTGISAQGYNKVYLCVGQTVGTFTLPDYRGRSPIGANTNVPGGAMDTNVDPVLAANAGYSIVAGTKKGEFAHILTIAELAGHTHEVLDPLHSHNYVGPQSGPHHTGGSADGSRDLISRTTELAATGINLQSSGGSQPHITVHPSIGTNFIMYVP